MTSGAQGGGGGGVRGGWRDRPRAAVGAVGTLNSVDPSSRWEIFP